MTLRTSLLDEYNRTMRRKLGHESLTEKLDAIRSGGGFRPAMPMAEQRKAVPASGACAADQPAVQVAPFE